MENGFKLIENFLFAAGIYVLLSETKEDIEKGIAVATEAFAE
ncbi:hypothetical protein [Flavitalea sp.]|nr:hypothetical protein [Flavitalea sp.]